jgi:peroxiredoxin
MSNQSHGDQCEASERLGLPYQLLSDDNMELHAELQLPTFQLNGKVYYKRVTLIIQDGVVAAVFYPVFPPDRNAEDVLDWLHNHVAVTQGEV